MRLVAPVVLAVMAPVSVACSWGPAASPQPTAAPTVSTAASPTAAASVASTFPLIIKDDPGQKATLLAALPPGVRRTAPTSIATGGKGR